MKCILTEVVENPEITVEANPDDLTENRIIELSKIELTDYQSEFNRF